MGDRVLLVGSWAGVIGFASFGWAFIFTRDEWQANASLISMGVWMFCGVLAIRRRRRAAQRDMQEVGG